MRVLLQKRAKEAERKAAEATAALTRAEQRIEEAERRAAEASSAVAFAEKRAMAADAELASAGVRVGVSPRHACVRVLVLHVCLWKERAGLATCALVE